MSAEAIARARLALHAAHAARTEARRGLEVARAASERARAFADGVRDEVDALRENDRGVAVDRSLAIKAAILAGETPALGPVAGLSENAARLADAESRLRSAEIARQHIEAEAGEAVRAMTAAEDAVRQAAEALMLAEANDIAEAIERLENEALDLRTTLGGGSYAPIAVRGQPLTPPLMRVLQATDRMAEASIGDFAGRLHGPMRAAGRAWLTFVDELVLDPDAELNFDEPIVEETARAA
jgi:hypothetical protein